MKPIQLLYAESFVSGPHHERRQTLSFAVLVENLAYQKQVEIRLAGPDGYWIVIPCKFERSTGQNGEVWLGSMQFVEGSREILTGDLSFAARAILGESEFWDSSDGANYCLKGDQGLWLAPNFPLLNINVVSRLAVDDLFLPLTVAVHASVQAQRVFLHWTNNHWRDTQTAECVFWRRHWEKHYAGHTHFPSERDIGAWVTHLPAEHAYRLEYAVGCEGPLGTYWDNNLGANFIARRDRLRVLTLNLHCYQEENQDAKFWAIARAIDEHDVDIICFQEVAEPWEGGDTARQSNAANIIRSRLKTHYHSVTDWSHRGFQIYREGTAILSRYDVLMKEAAFVSDGQDENSIHSRKVVMATVNVPYIGPINVFSVHLSWWKDGFRSQFDRLRTWANERHSHGAAATLLLGDFNAQVDSEGYRYVTAQGGYEDQYLKACGGGRNNRDGTNHTALQNDQRIDFIFMKAGSALEVKSSKALFTDSDYGRVSDHVGYFADFEPPL